MFCPTCGYSNRDISRFCVRCGTPLQGAPTVVAVNPPVSTAAPHISAPAASIPSQGFPPAEATAAINPQDTLHGRYFIVKEFGGGGMGKVYLALDTQNYNRQCIVKEMLPYFTTPEEQVEAERNFERECQLLAKLNYPAGIPQIFDHFTDGGKFYLIMTFVEGQNLEQKMQSAGGKLPEAQVIEYGLQVCGILSYLAKQQPPVIHRDIKPANLIVNQHTGQVMLVDFGIAKAIHGVGTASGIINSQTSWGVLKSSPLGTAGYAPPEQYQGMTEARSDVYGLGATMHHLLTGKSPQAAAAPFDFPPVRALVPTLSEEIEQVVTHALTMDVRQRPTADQLKSELIAAKTPAQPSTPGTEFYFRSGEVAHSIPELALKAESNWSDGVYHLMQGHLEQWLRAQNRHDLASVAESLRKRGGDTSAALEDFLRAINTQIRPPVLGLGSNTLDFGSLMRGAQSEIELKVYNNGRGYLHGTIKSNVPWLTLAHGNIGCMSGTEQTIKVKIDTRTVQEGAHGGPALEINTNGGVQTVTAQVNVTWAPVLTIKPQNRLDFGNVLPGTSVTRPIALANMGGGTLNGEIACDGGWFWVPQAQFSVISGQPISIQAIATTTGLGVGIYEGHITITTPLNQVVIPARIGLKKPMYDLPSRAMKWGVFVLCAIASLFACSLTTSLGTRGVLGLVPINPLSGQFLSLFGRFTPVTADTRALADLFGMGTLLGLGTIGLIAWAIGRTQNRALDEIEDFYHGSRLDEEIMPSEFSAWRYLVITGLLALGGLLIGLKFNYTIGNDWLGWGLLIAPFAGILIGGGITIAGAQIPGLVNTHSRLAAFERVFFVASGMAIWGAMLGVTRNGPGEWWTAVVWAMVGFVFASDTLNLPARMHWVLSVLRPSLLVAFFGYILEMLALAAILFVRSGRASFLPVDACYRAFPGPTDAFQVLIDIITVPVVLVGGLIGLAAVNDASVERVKVAKTMAVAAVPSLLLGMLGMFLGGVLFWVLTLGRGWSLGTFLVTAGVIAAGLAFIHLQTPLIQRGEDATKARLVALSKNRPLPAWLNRLSLVALARSLTPLTIGATALLTALLMPLVLQISISLIILLLCLGALAFGAAIVVGVIVLAARTQVRTR